MDLGIQIKFFQHQKINKFMKKGIKIKRKVHTPLRRPPRLSKEAHKFGIKPIKKQTKGRKK